MGDMIDSHVGKIHPGSYHVSDIINNREKSSTSHCSKEFNCCCPLDALRTGVLNR